MIPTAAGRGDTGRAIRRFLENACLLGGAILIWLAVLVSIALVVLSIAAWGDIEDWWGDDTPAVFTDELGRECLPEHVDPEMNLCP